MKREKSNIVQVTKAGQMKLGALLKKHREDQGWSQDRLVEIIRERIGASIVKSTISGIERGNQIPTCDTLLLLSQVGYLPYSFTELVDIATENRLALCEKPTPYRVNKEAKEAIAV
jgi:transcriptional regulator with XRE-family HTH domain